MITDTDINKLTKVFATKDDLKAMEDRQDRKYATKDDLKQELENTKKDIVQEITDFLQDNILNLLNEHERRLDRLEKTVGGFPPLTS